MWALLCCWLYKIKADLTPPCWPRSHLWTAAGASVRWRNLQSNSYATRRSFPQYHRVSVSRRCAEGSGGGGSDAPIMHHSTTWAFNRKDVSNFRLGFSQTNIILNAAHRAESHSQMPLQIPPLQLSLSPPVDRRRNDASPQNPCRKPLILALN